MSKNRVTINLTFTADLDSIPGWGNNPVDWLKLVKRKLDDLAPHYSTLANIDKATLHLYDGSEMSINHLEEFNNVKYVLFHRASVCYVHDKNNFTKDKKKAKTFNSRKEADEYHFETLDNEYGYEPVVLED